MPMDDLSLRLEREVQRLGGPSQVARALGRNRNTVTNWCKAGNIPAKELAELGRLGADTCYILTGESGGGEVLSGDERQWIEWFRMMRPDDRQLLTPSVRMAAETAQAGGAKRHAG